MWGTAPSARARCLCCFRITEFFGLRTRARAARRGLGQLSRSAIRVMDRLSTMRMTRSKLPLLLGFTTSLFALRCGGDGESPFTDAGGRAGAGPAGSAGQGASAGNGGSAGVAGAPVVCSPAASEACVGENECSGTKLCLDDGSAFGACECEAGHAGEGGAPVSAGGEGGGAGAEPGGAGGAEGGMGGETIGGGGGEALGGAGGEPGVSGAGPSGAAGVTAGEAGETGEAGGAGGGPPVTIEVTDLKDTYAQECNRGTSNGSEEIVSVDTSPCVYEAFFAPIEALPIPVGAVVTSAVLTLSCTNAGDSVSVHALASSWNEATLDWNSRPDAGALLGSFVPAVGAIEIDLTELVQTWVDTGTAFGVGLSQTGEDGSDYASSESAMVNDRPRLAITYTR
jgi:hypothetical protein